MIKEIGAVIKKLAARGDMAILLVEQFYDFAAELADQYLVMSRGEIIQQGRGENMAAEGATPGGDLAQRPTGRLIGVNVRLSRRADD